MPAQPQPWRLALALITGVLAGCASGPAPLTIDRSITAISQNSRVEFLVLHYTNSPTARSLQLLSRGPVSSHYLITDDNPPQIYQLVDESQRAWHAGESAWRGRTWLNASSIGIEIVHEPFVPGTAALPQPEWAAWNPQQINALLALARDIIDRHDIRAENVVGHSDIAPTRKQDPGPAFPWQQLAQHGIGQWYSAAAVQAWQQALAALPEPSLAWFAPRLAALGYATTTANPSTDPSTALQAALRAFQMRWRPARHDGNPDQESAAILLALLNCEAPAMATHSPPLATAAPTLCAPHPGQTETTATD